MKIGSVVFEELCENSEITDKLKFRLQHLCTEKQVIEIEILKRKFIILVTIYVNIMFIYTLMIVVNDCLSLKHLLYILIYTD